MNPEEKTQNNTQENKAQERIPIKSLRTFQGDVQEAISKNKFSSTTILVSEQKRKLEKPISEVSVQNFKFRNNAFIFFGTLFIVLGAISIISLYYIKSNEQVVIEKKTKTLLPYSAEKIISLSSPDREDLMSKFSENKSSWNAPVNSILYMNPLYGNEEIKTSEILSIVAPSMSPSLIRAFGDKYMFGIYSFDTNEQFIILTVDDFSLAYPGMLKWEKDSAKDLARMFDIKNETDINAPVFTDVVIKNKDIRILKDIEGNSLLLYSFIDRKTLVITKNENILSVLVGKFLINKQAK